MSLFKKITLSVITSAAMLTTTNSAAQTTLFDTPFETTYKNSTLSMPYRIPAIVETENATTGAKELLYFGDKRHCGMDIGWGSSANAFVSGNTDYYRIDIVSKRSTDGGKTWGEETVVKQGTATCGYGDIAVVSNRENQKEIVAFAATGNVRYGNSTTSNPLKTTRLYSADGGQTWSATDMTSAMYNLLPYSSDKALFFTSGRICQSKQIKVGDYYRLYSALCVYNGSTSNAVVVYSDDFGSNWNVLGSGYAVSGGDESKVEELPNGNVLISSRIYSGYDSNGRRRFNVFGYSSLPTSANTASGSWGTVYSGIQYTGTTKPCNGEILLVPAKDASGNSCNILLHSEPYGTTEAEGRGNVSIFWKVLSSDNITSASEFEGTNWNRFPVSTTTSAYSTMIQQHDGTIAFAYEETIWGNGSGAPSASINKITWGEHGYDLKYQNFTIADITNNQYAYDAGEEEETPVVETVETPVINPAGGEVESGAKVAITCATDGAAIYYTTDGTTPSTTNGKAYTGAITITEAMTLSAVAVKAGWNDSEVTTAVFTITPEEEEPEDDNTITWKFNVRNCYSGTCAWGAWSSMYLDCAVELPIGVSAYRATYNSAKQTVSLRRIKSDVVPAYYAVILLDVSKRKEITLTKTTTDYNPGENVFQGTLEGIAVDNPDLYYVLGHTSTGHYGFYHPSTATIGANKAYLKLEEEMAEIKVRFEDEDATGIEDIFSEESDDAPIYDLTGRKVNDTSKPGIYIKNGKKFIVR